MKKMVNITKFLSIAALFFYVLCWFTHQDSKVVWYIGIGLPWLSLIASIPINILRKSHEDKSGVHWAYTYVVMTVAYFLVISIMEGSVWHQLTHIAACVCFISCFELESYEKKEEELKKKIRNINLSSEKALEEIRHFDDLYPKTVKLNQILIDILNESEEVEEKH